METLLLRAALHLQDAVVAADVLVARVGMGQNHVLVSHARVVCSQTDRHTDIY